MFYVRAISGKWRVPAWRDILRLIPFALALAAQLAIMPSSRDCHFDASSLNILLWGGTVVQLFAYLLVTANTASLHDRALRNLRSTKDGDLAWIKTFLSVITGISLIDFLLFVWSIHGGEIPYFHSIRSLVLCLAVYGLGFHALLRPPARIYEAGVETHAAQANPAPRLLENEKYERSGLSREESDRIAA